MSSETLCRWCSICLCALALASGPLLAQSNLIVEGEVEATAFTGDGSNLTNVELSGWQRGFFDFSCGGSTVCFVFVACPFGSNVLSGGLELPGLTLGEKSNISLDDTFPLSDSQWQVTATNFGASSATYRAWAICAPVSGAAPTAPLTSDPPTFVQSEALQREVFLMCPEGDVSAWVESSDEADYFCENHYVPLERSAGSAQPIPTK